MQRTFVRDPDKTRPRGGILHTAGPRQVTSIGAGDAWNVEYLLRGSVRLTFVVTPAPEPPWWCFKHRCLVLVFDDEVPQLSEPEKFRLWRIWQAHHLRHSLSQRTATGNQQQGVQTDGPLSSCGIFATPAAQSNPMQDQNVYNGALRQILAPAQASKGVVRCRQFSLTAKLAGTATA